MRPLRSVIVHERPLAQRTFATRTWRRARRARTSCSAAVRRAWPERASRTAAPTLASRATTIATTTATAARRRRTCRVIPGRLRRMTATLGVVVVVVRRGEPLDLGRDQLAVDPMCLDVEAAAGPQHGGEPREVLEPRRPGDLDRHRPAFMVA